MLADEPPGVDHARVGRAGDPPYEREVARGRQPPRERRRRLQVGEQDRRPPAPGARDALHPIEVPQVPHGRDPRDDGHADGGLGDHDRTHDPACFVAYSQQDHADIRSRSGGRVDPRERE
jgi:hypothetical protein